MKEFVSNETTAGRGVNLCVASVRRCFGGEHTRPRVLRCAPSRNAPARSSSHNFALCERSKPAREGAGRNTRGRVCSLLFAAALWLCIHGAAAATLEIAMRHVGDGQPLQLGSLRSDNSAGENFSITRLSYLLSGFAFQREDGSWLELGNSVAWFDAEKERTSARFEIPSGTYLSVRFNVGLETNLNHADVARFPFDHPLNPNLSGLHWSWQGGYIFMALEGMWQSSHVPRDVLDSVAPLRAPSLNGGRDGNGQTPSIATARAEPDHPSPSIPLPVEGRGMPERAALSGFSFHLARDTNCAVINLGAALDLTRDARLELDVDLTPLLNAPRAISFAKDGSSTHSRDGDPIAAALVANLPGAFRVRQVLARDTSLAEAATMQPLFLPAKFTPYRFSMSAVFPIPDLPRDNPLTEERVALGEKLFHDPLLSRDGTISCASCHDSKSAFSDPRRYSVGVRNQTGTRQAMPLFNLAWKNSFFWDGRAPSLRAQALMPIQDHGEMDESLSNVVAKLEGRAGCPQPAADAVVLSRRGEDTAPYLELFTRAFGSPEVTAEKIGLALEQFMLTLTSSDSRFDRAFRGEAQLSDDEKRGFELFMTEYDPRRGQFGADCFHCHGGALFQSQTFANNGLDAKFSDMGRAKITGKDSDAGKFSTPSLRNIALTAPYMHDGRFATLEEVVAHYSTGVQRSATLDPNLAKHPDGGLHLSKDDQRALVKFLQTLTDDKFRAREVPARRTPAACGAPCVE